MDMFDLAGMLFGNRRDSVAQGSTLTATGSAASEDGTAYLVMDADVTPAEGVGDDTDQTVIDVPTSPSVAEGDEVIMTLVGDGPLKTPVVMANPGFGDRMAASVSNAEALAEQAEAVAQEAAEDVEQVRQDVADFRDDVATTYATKVEREDGDDAVKTWVTTNYTNTNDLATTYATKTLVSQTKDAIELAASQTYETQTDAAATYATKAALTVGLDGIRSEVAEDYQPKGDYATTASMNSAIQQSASSIESSVAATYETKSDAAATYATKTEVQQTASGLDTRITTAQSTADGAYLERTATGTTIDTTGAATIRSLVVEGQSVQDGTPSPSAPVPIVSVESRNLLPAPESWTYSSAFSISDGVVTKATQSAASWMSFRLYCFPATSMYGRELTVSFEHRSDDFVPMSSYPALTVDFEGSASNNGARTKYRRLGTASESPVPTTEWEKWSYTFTCSGDGWFNAGSGEVNFVGIGIWSNTTSSFQIRNIQLELGTTANPYQPYGCVTLVAGSTRTDIDLQGHALRSLPDGTRDEMAVDSLGRVTMTQRVGSVDMGTLAWTLGTLGSGAAFFYSGAIADRKAGTRVMAAPFASVEGNRNNITADCQISDYNSGNGRVAARYDSIATAVDFRTAMTGVMLYYKLATPQTIDLGTIDLPTPADTLWLDAAIVPTIGATWWTVGGIAGQQALDAEVTERQTLIRQFSGGVLAGYVGNAIAALVNAAGSFDVVRTAWSDGVPSILGTLARYAASGISLFDAAGNVLAEFASDHVRIGGAIPEDGSAVATVRFFDSDADKGAMVEGYISNSYSPTDEDVGWGVQTQDTYTDLHTSTNDSDMEQVNGCAGTADVRLGQTTYWEDGPDGYYQAESTATLIATADGGTDPTQTAHASASLGVKAVTVNDDYERSYLTVNGNDVPMEQVIAVLSSPVTLFTGTYAQTHSAAVTLSETAANFSRLEFICENNDGERTSVTVTDPNGKHFNVVMVTMAGPTGTGTYAYMKAKSFSINGTSVTCRTYTYNGQTIYRHGSVTLRNDVAVAATQASEEIGIVKVLGWR